MAFPSSAHFRAVHDFEKLDAAMRSAVNQGRAMVRIARGQVPRKRAMTIRVTSVEFD
jgi:hypothetical protein